MGQRLTSQHDHQPPCGRILALRRPVRVPPSATPLRALYDEEGTGASWLARSLAGHRITCTGLLGRMPGGAGNWLAIGEGVIAPCPGCGGDHHWPVGVLAVEAAEAPPDCGPFTAATVQGVLDARQDAGLQAGIGGRLALRDAVFLRG